MGKVLQVWDVLTYEPVPTAWGEALKSRLGQMGIEPDTYLGRYEALDTFLAENPDWTPEAV